MLNDDADSGLQAAPLTRLLAVWVQQHYARREAARLEFMQ